MTHPVGAIGLAVITAVITSHVHGHGPGLDTFNDGLREALSVAAVIGAASVAITAVVLPRRSRSVPWRRYPRRPPSLRPSLLITIAITDEKKETSMNDPQASTSTPMLTEIVLPGLVGPESLSINQRPVPTPGEGQALVEMLATGVSFAEKGMRRNRYPGQPKFPFVLGYDLVGVVTDVGAKVDPALIGQRVAAVMKTGAWSTHCLVNARDLVPVPDGLDAGEAETLVVNGITAWQMLTETQAKPVRRSSSTAPTAASGTPSSSSLATLASASSRPPHRATTTRSAKWAPNPSTTTTPTV